MLKSWIVTPVFYLTITCLLTLLFINKYSRDLINIEDKVSHSDALESRF